VSRHHPAGCGECHAPVIWALTPLGKRIPLNPRQDPDGNVAAYRDGTGRWCARVLKKDEQPQGYERLYMPHFATCPARRRSSRPSQAGGAEVIDLRSRRRRRRSA
jgi:hypothetical protein